MSKQQSPTPSVPQKFIEYEARDGVKVGLSIDIVKQFLVTGKRELVTAQELTYFVGVCRARGLNPFARDCYLIKFTDEAAQIVIAIDFYRARARAQKDCTGWEKGVICLKPDGELRYSKGLVLPGETLVGGWFRAQPTSWSIPFELEVNLSGYIKKTKTGEITKFWRPENQPTMIMKVAESQGLRTLWPDEFRGTITAEEASLQLDNFDTIDIESLRMEPEAEPVDTSAFDKLVQDLNLDTTRSDMLDKFIQECAIANSRKGGAQVAAEDVKAKAAADFPKFWGAFEKWAVADAEITEKSEAPAGNGPATQAATESDRQELAAIAKEATEKQMVAQVFAQFKVNGWDDFLALDRSMIPMVKQFVAEAPPAPIKGKGK